MIKNSKIVQTFEKELIKKENVNLTKNFQIMDAMYKEARALGAIPMKDPDYNAKYIKRWLQVFDKSLNEKFLKTFRRIAKEIR